MPRWSDALVAWLHDPPDKALDILGHESRAGDACFRRAALPITRHNRAYISGWSTDRQALPRSRPDRRPDRAPNPLAPASRLPHRLRTALKRHARCSPSFVYAVWPHAPAAYRARRTASTKLFSWSRRLEDCRSDSSRSRPDCTWWPAGVQRSSFEVKLTSQPAILADS